MKMLSNDWTQLVSRFCSGQIKLLKRDSVAPKPLGKLRHQVDVVLLLDENASILGIRLLHTIGPIWAIIFNSPSLTLLC
jgi:hypothetical protein